jgi:hypothetical protein
VTGTGQRGGGDLGLGGDGYWFAGPNNYVTNNIVSDLDVNGPYGYGFEYYTLYGSSEQPLGKVNIPAYQGADPSQPGQYQTVDMNLMPILQFQGNEAYGAMAIGLSYWDINYDPNSSVAPLASGGVIKDFIAWNFWQAGVYAYPGNNITIDGLVERGDASVTASGDGAVGISDGDYYQGNLTITNADIQGQAVGISVPVNTSGTTTIENSHLADLIGIDVPALWNVSYTANAIPPRNVVINNVAFAAPWAGAAFTSINMDWYTQNQLANGTVNVTQTDVVKVYNYDQIAGDNFQLFYTQQAANFVVPQTISNSDGTPKLKGAPVAGLTNAQAWTLYGIAIGGEVAPSTATQLNGIIGLVAPI